MKKTGNLSDTVWRILLILAVLLAYGHSLQPARVSSQESGLILQICRQLLRTLGGDGSWLSEHLIRKCAHFSEYALIGFLLLMNFRPWLRENAGRFWQMALLAVLIPLVDETIQLFVAGRSGQISDVWLDLSGVIAGGSLTWLAGRWKPHRKGKENEL